MKKYLLSNYLTKMQIFAFLLLFGTKLFAGINNGAEEPNNVFICPEDITIGCCQDYTNTDVTGHPMMNNPDFIYFTYIDSVYLNECREGHIVRTWTGYNGIGQWECQQLIHMKYMTDFDGTIQWPKDWVGSCGDEIPFTQPYYEPGFCDQFAHNYQDDTLRIQGSVCMKILRNWKVVDWCKYKPNSGSDLGLWEHTQIFKIMELDKPEFTFCSDWEIGAENSDCTASFQLGKSATDQSCNISSDLSWKVEIDFFNNWSFDTLLHKSGDSIVVDLNDIPIGQHKIVWTVSDNCGNASQCMELINVEDGKDPTPFCYLSVPTVLMPQFNMLEVNARQFIKEAEDNCSDQSDLIYSWSSDPADTVRIFDCDDIGFQFLPIYVIDETGNYDFCFIFTRVVNHGDCNSLPSSIRGRITSFDGVGVEDLTISLGNNALLNYEVDTTDHKGEFYFPYVETIAEPALYVEKKGGAMAGITTLDLVYLNKYLLGLIKPTNERSFSHAADVNRDGKVNVQDLIDLKEIVLGLEDDTTDQSASGVRLFVEDDLNPGQYIEVEALDELSDHINLKVIRVGDVDDLFGED